MDQLFYGQSLAFDKLESPCEYQIPFLCLFLFTFISASLELPPCLRRMEAAKAGIKLGLQDISYPRCDKDGYFAPVQCSLLGGCSCVDKYGNRTFRPKDRFFGWPNCGK